MYRPRSRSPPGDRSRRYSPSRPLPRSNSRSPPYRRAPPSPPPFRPPYDQPYSPPRRPHPDDDVPPPRRYDLLPPRRYEDEFPPRRYGDDYPPPPTDYRSRRSPSPPRRRYERDTSPPRASSMRQDISNYREDRYEPPPSNRMRADDEEVRRRIDELVEDVRPASPSKWERGLEVGEYEQPPQSTRLPERRPRGGKQPSDSSRDVIFLGLDAELTESDLMGYLRTEHRALVDSVKIVLDKVTGASKCFGFAAFASLEGAEEFINHNFPAVLMPALHEYSEPRKVKIDFSASMTGSNAPGGSSSGSYAPRPGHDGLRDVGSGANNNRVLLLRGLNYYSTPAEIIARLGQEIARLVGNTARPAQGEKTICRLVLMLDKNARTSWGYGFVELATHQLAAALLAFLISPQTQPEGFQIFDFAVAATFANAGAFVPVPSGPLGSELVVHASRHGGIGGDTIDQADGSFVGYWHPDAIPQETVPIGAPKIDDKGAVEPLNGEMKAFLGILSGSTDPDTAESSGQASRQSNVPNSAGPISISLGGAANKIGGKGKRVEETGFVVMEQKNLLGGDDEETDQVGQDTVLLSRVKGVANIIGPSTRKIAKDISKWNNKKDELLKPVEPDWSKPPGGLSDANAAIGVPRSQNRTPSKQEEQDDFDYTDTSSFSSTGKVACLLCQRQFKAEDALKKHVALSDLHKTNLLDAACCEAGKRRKAASETRSAVDEGPKYRDRAAERREVHHQPDKPIPGEAPNLPQKRKFAEGPKPPAPTPEPGSAPGEDESNMGNQLLAKMGWKTGVGLGTTGEGRVDPVQVQQFENRAGLGASKGREAGKWQGPGGFQQRAKDMARERYDSSSGS